MPPPSPTALDYVGVLGVEFFVLADGGLVVNEIAPRVHNSGHWTEAVCVTDQFEQHIRAIAGWPLGDPTRLADVVMENLIGDEIAAIPGRARRRASARTPTASPSRGRAARWATSTGLHVQNAREIGAFSPVGPVDKPRVFYYTRAPR